MTPCGPITLEVGPVLAVILVQGLTLAATLFAGFSARGAAARAADLVHAQTHLTAAIVQGAPTDATMHKE